MTTEETKKLGREIQVALNSVNLLLKHGEEQGVKVTLSITRKNSTTVDIIENIQLQSMSQDAEIEFEVKNKGNW